MNQMNFTEPLNKIIFFGGNIHMTNAILVLKEKFESIDIEILVSNRHLTNYINDEYNLKEFLLKFNIKYSVIINVNEYFENKDLSGIYGMSFGSPWIFKKNLIERFNGKLLNFHNDILPNYRGAASVSWRILMGTRIGSCTCHLVDEGIDSGDIIYQEPFLYESSCRIPIDYETFLTQKFKPFFGSLIEKIVNQEELKLQSQQNIFEEYWPRLNTTLNGFINWNMVDVELDRFICAFDRPYDGASTYLKNEKCFLRDVMLDYTRSSFHPYQYGLVYKKNNLGVFVAVNGATLIVREILNKEKKSILDSIKIGDRFYTPQEALDDAKGKRVFYDLNGLK